MESISFYNLIPYVLPIILLILSFLLKLFIDRTVSLPSFISALLELPVDIMFLGLSFIAAFTITYKEKAGIGLLLFLTYLIIAILIIFCWRRAIKAFEASKLSISSLLGILNFLISIPALIFSIILIIKG